MHWVKAVLCAGELELQLVGQLTHWLGPVGFLYLPATHDVHRPPSAPDQPALHLHAAKAVLCSGELEPAGQLLQSAAAGRLLYFPATHAVHVSPSAPDQPALQVQFAIVMLAIGESEFVGQTKHATSPVAATAVEYFPCSHGLHADDPVDVVYFPGAHVAHVPPAGPE